MSIKVMSWYWDNSEQDGRRLLALLALADWANDDGECYPGMAAIAKRIRRTERTAQKIVSELEEIGEILVAPEMGVPGQGGNTSRYYLLAWRKQISAPIPPAALKLANERRAAEKKNGEKRGEGLREGVKVSARRGEGLRKKGVKVSSPDPSIEPSVEPSVSYEASASENLQWEMMLAVADVLRWTIGNANKGRIGKIAKDLLDAGYTPELVRQWYKDVWKKEWPGSTGQAPRQDQLINTIGRVKDGKEITDLSNPNHPTWKSSAPKMSAAEMESLYANLPF